MSQEDKKQHAANLAIEAQQIKQEYKEKAIQQRARDLDLSYVNLLKVPINPDVAKIISKEEAQDAKAAVYLQSGKKIKVAVIELDEKAQALVSRLRDDGYWAEVSLCSEESLEAAHKVYFTSKYIKEEETENIVEEQDLGSFVEEVAGLQELGEKIESSKSDTALNYIQVGAHKAHSSDIHFQPEEEYVLLRLRIDGVLRPILKLSLKAYDGIIKEIKYLSHLKLNVTNIPQDGQYSFLINKRQINVRVSTLPTHYGEACVMRLLDAQRAKVSFEDLGFDGKALENIRAASKLSHGMILVTGPTGSGKTTTLYSVLQSIDTNEKKVITLEDPVEYNLEGISQSQIDEEKEYDFATGLRAILRQDPDVIMIGEIRDLETAETAVQASLTGHLVISTLHTNSAVESIPRLINMGLKSFILAPAIDLIIAQRLVRKLCSDCVENVAITESEKSHLGSIIESIRNKGVEVPTVPDILKKSKGCEKCGDSGFKGQLAIVEALRFDQSLRNLILEKRSMPEIYGHINKESGMLTMHEDGILKVIQGLTTLEEVNRVA